jgi:hypothetical protein
MITQEPGPTGRGANTAWWAGIANLFWWADREKGVAGMIASQCMYVYCLVQSSLTLRVTC